MAKDEDVMDKVIKLDRLVQQSEADSFLCPNEPKHGKMAPNESGTLLVCCLCDRPVPVMNTSDLLKE